MVEYDLIILYSGGADSRLLLEFALSIGKHPLCVLINYEQKHLKELEYAVEQLKDKAPYRLVALRGLDLNSGLTGDQTESRWEGVHSMNVPGRNTMFISIAASIAEDVGAQEIWYGANWEDRDNLFPDCYQEYVYDMNKMLKVSGVRPIKLTAPLLGWTKPMITGFLSNLGINRKSVFSGYEEYEEGENEDENNWERE